MLAPTEIQGSSEWQTALLVVAGIWLFLSVVRGWSNGLLRQVLGLVAIVLAGLVSVMLAEPLSSMLRARVNLPGFVVGLLSVFLIWMVFYHLIMFVGRLLLRRTSDQESDLFRLICGLGGAFIGLAYGLAVLWALLIGIRVTGRVAEKQVDHVRTRQTTAWLASATKLKNSLELGYGRWFLDLLDPVPPSFYHTIDLCARIASEPQLIQKVLLYPGFRHLWSNPKFNHLGRDPELVAAIRSGNVLELAGHPKIIGLLNDPEIRAAFSREQLESALLFANNEAH